MKTRFLLIATMAIFTSATLWAGTYDATPKTEVGRFLERNIQFPANEQYSNTQGSVCIALSAGENNTVKVQVLSSDSDQLSKYVKRRIQRLEPRLAKLITDEEPQIVRLRFELN